MPFNTNPRITVSLHFSTRRAYDEQSHLHSSSRSISATPMVFVRDGHGIIRHDAAWASETCPGKEEMQGHQAAKPNLECDIALCEDPLSPRSRHLRGLRDPSRLCATSDMRACFLATLITYRSHSCSTDPLMQPLLFTAAWTFDLFALVLVMYEYPRVIPPAIVGRKPPSTAGM